jgi:hypothetical protein
VRREGAGSVVVLGGEVVLAGGEAQSFVAPGVGSEARTVELDELGQDDLSRVDVERAAVAAQVHRLDLDGARHPLADQVDGDSVPTTRHVIAVDLGLGRNASFARDAHVVHGSGHVIECDRRQMLARTEHARLVNAVGAELAHELRESVGLRLLRSVVATRDRQRRGAGLRGGAAERREDDERDRKNEGMDVHGATPMCFLSARLNVGE